MLAYVSREMDRLAAPHDELHACQEPLMDTDHENMTQTCRVFYLGSLVKALINGNCFPIWQPASLRNSTSQVRRELYTIASNMQHMEQLTKGARRPGQYIMVPVIDHGKCSPGPSLSNTLNNIRPRVVLSSKQEAHLVEQAKKSGV